MIWQKYSKYSRIEHPCFGFHVVLLVITLSARKLHTKNNACMFLLLTWVTESWNLFAITLLIQLFTNTRPVWAQQRCRISPSRFLAECCTRRLNQGTCSFDFAVLCLVCFFELYLFVYFSALFCLFSISQVIGCEDRLRHDLDCVGWDVIKH